MGHAIAEEAGTKVAKAKSHSALRYNKENLLNSWFVVVGKE